MKISLILEAVDRATAPVRRVEGSVRQLGRANGATAGAARQLGAAEHSAGASTTRLGSRLTALSRRLHAVTTGPGSMAALERVTHGAGSAMGSLARRAGGLALGGVGIATAGLTGLFGYLTGGVISTASQFEAFQTTLEAALGSSAKAKAAMGWISDFAVRTPYELAEVTEAFKMLTSYGLDPKAALTPLGDAASAMGKPLSDAVEMIADATTGEYERLKAFSIRASTAGNKVTLTYNKAGKEISTSVGKGMPVMRAVLRILEERFPNAMNKQSLTFGGLMANLSDQFTRFQLAVANAGFFDAVKSKIEGLLGTVNRLAESGELGRWASRIGRQLTDMVERGTAFAKGINWSEVAADLQSVGTAAMGVVRLLARMVELASKFNTVLRGLPHAPGWVGAADKTAGNWLTTPFSQWSMFGGGGPMFGGGHPRQPTRNYSPAETRQLWHQPLRRDFALRPGPPVLLLPGRAAPAWPRGHGAGAGAGTRPASGNVKVEIELKGSGASQARVSRISADNGIAASLARGRAMSRPM